MDRAQALRWMRGNAAAADFLEVAFRIAHAWDDLIDQDKAYTDRDINRAFLDALVVLPRNPFYRAHFDALNPVLANAITNWHIATRLERVGTHKGRRQAYVLRAAYVDLVTHSALLLGGMEWAVAVGAELRPMAEDYDSYLTNLKAEEAARGA